MMKQSAQSNAAGAARRKGDTLVAVVAAAILIVGIAAAFFAVTALPLSGCVSTSFTHVAPTPEPYVSPYDFDSLTSENGRLTYAPGGTVQSLTGIDVSEHEHEIDWQQVANDGIDFAFVRIGRRGYTEGGLFADEYGQQNLDGAAAAGLKVGAYFFSQATSVDEAVEEARFAIELLGGRSLDFPVAFDHERVSDPDGRANYVGTKVLTDAAAAFCHELEMAGYRTIIYGNQYDLGRFNMKALSSHAIWFAQYAKLPTAQFDFTIWQYSCEGQVAGIQGNCDMDLLFLTSPQTW